MTIFNEIYGVYFLIAGKILGRRVTDEGQIYSMINKYGFRDSILFLPQKLIPQGDGSDWGLLTKDGSGRLLSVLSHAPESRMTNIQKRWLKAILSDPKARLFLDESDILRLEEKLKDIKPLFCKRHFCFTDRFSDGDPFDSDEYRRNFRTILRAVHEKRVLDIDFVSGHGKRIRRPFVPVKIEYSPKNDKFRLYCFMLRKNGKAACGLINIGRITAVNETAMIWDKPLPVDELYQKTAEPVTVKVTAERNAVERFMMECACYEKQTERDLSTGVCTVKLWYDDRDETELLIRLLSFGPVLEILGPESFRKQAAERISKQFKLING